jgi:hypothetical protein
MAKSVKKPPRPVVARERIYSSGVYRHVDALLKDLDRFVCERPDALRFPQAHVDLERGEFSPFGFVQHWGAARFLAKEPRREHMHQWVQMVAMHMIGEAGERLTDYRSIFIPFLLNQSFGKGVGYLTRAKTTPEELAEVLPAARADLRQVGPDGLLKIFYGADAPEYWEPKEPPRGVMLVDVEPER